VRKVPGRLLAVIQLASAAHSRALTGLLHRCAAVDVVAGGGGGGVLVAAVVVVVMVVVVVVVAAAAVVVVATAGVGDAACAVSAVADRTVAFAVGGEGHHRADLGSRPAEEGHRAAAVLGVLAMRRARALLVAVAEFAP